MVTLEPPSDECFSVVLLGDTALVEDECFPVVLLGDTALVEGLLLCVEVPSWLEGRSRLPDDGKDMFVGCSGLCSSCRANTNCPFEG